MSDLPRPRQEVPYTEHELIGMQLIVPIDFEWGVPPGWNTRIHDIYEPGQAAWQFRRRLKVFSRTLCKCGECADGRISNPEMPDQILEVAQ